MNATLAPCNDYGTPAVALATPDGGRAVVALFGAQLLSWQPAPGDERLYLSPQAVFDGATAIRGGVPVCFPQFAAQGRLPRHGFARTRNWTLANQRLTREYALATFTLEEADDTFALWPHGFSAALTVSLEAGRLDIELEIENTGYGPFAFGAALHTYLAVAEVEHAELRGLAGVPYRDSLSGARNCTNQDEVLGFDGPVDRIYTPAPGLLHLRDSRRSTRIEISQFPDVVVWNPWHQAEDRPADLPPTGFRRMLCVEAAAAAARMQVDAGESWFGRQSLIVA